jgi:putative Mg2+ transporter-C (MgtC) family protein
MDELELVPRLVVAFGIGAMLGFDRERRRKPAGLKTHVLVAVASAMLMALSELVQERGGETVGDPVRMAQGVLTGIGFIGAGTIIRQGDSVIGITTAGTIWMAAALGLVAGAGFYVLALAGAVLALIAVNGLKWLERWME